MDTSSRAPLNQLDEWVQYVRKVLKGDAAMQSTGANPLSDIHITILNTLYLTSLPLCPCVERIDLQNPGIPLHTPRRTVP